jgi:NAD(P)H-dependent FMN reductase
MRLRVLGASTGLEIRRVGRGPRAQTSACRSASKFNLPQQFWGLVGDFYAPGGGVPRSPRARKHVARDLLSITGIEMLNLQVIVASTRDERKGPLIAEWFMGQARAHGQFDVELVDLREVGLPLFDEPRHPRLQQYEHEHTRRWSEVVQRADAFVFVTPEYNFSTPPSLVNALDYLVKEWAYKPAGFVSYGGVSAGLRGVQMSKQLVGALRMIPVVEAVAIPMFPQHIDAATGVFDPGAVQAQAATAMLDELLKLANALKPLRG